VTFLSRTFFVEKKEEIVITTPQQTRQGEDQRQSKRVLLRSEIAVPQIMPSVLRTGDLVALFLLNVFWVSNITPIVLFSVIRTAELTAHHVRASRW